jgi:hypothetical protein
MAPTLAESSLLDSPALTGPPPSSWPPATPSSQYAASSPHLRRSSAPAQYSSAAPPVPAHAHAHAHASLLPPCRSSVDLYSCPWPPCSLCRVIHSSLISLLSLILLSRCTDLTNPRVGQKCVDPAGAPPTLCNPPKHHWNLPPHGRIPLDPPLKTHRCVHPEAVTMASGQLPPREALAEAGDAPRH